MKRIIITMPAMILVKYPRASRKLIWEPTSKQHYTFLQLGWSGGRSRLEKLRDGRSHLAPVATAQTR